MGARGGVGTANDVTANDVERKLDSRHRAKRPSMHVVLVHNDDFTPRQFVVEALKRFFAKTESEATRIMLLAHRYGVGVIAKYPREIAEAKADQVTRYARECGYPLAFSTQEE